MKFKIRGMTLIELIIIITIIAILAGISAQFLTSIFKGYIHGQDLINKDTETGVALNRMTNDLHNLRSSADITTARSNNLVFTDLYGNAISYQVTGSQLQRNNLTLSKDVQSITLKYYDQFGNLLPTPVIGANIALIQYMTISLTIGTFTYSTGVALWNII